MSSSPVLSLGTRREPLFDRFLIERLRGLSHELVDPFQTRIDVPLHLPWEGAYGIYASILADRDRFRLYYRGQGDLNHEAVTCYAESPDGRNWSKPELDLFPWGSQPRTNIVHRDPDPQRDTAHNFTPFIDQNPAAPVAERYKAVGGTEKSGLYGFVSADGYHWRPVQTAPIHTGGVFDSQNVPFWSEAESCYVLYFRIWTEGLFKGRRTIARSTSPDFIHWSPPEPMSFVGGSPTELYTNVTQPCPGAPHLYLALPSRFVPQRQWLSSPAARAAGVREGREADLSDTLFMTSRGGTTYDQTFTQAYLRPGADPQDWVGRNNMVAVGLLTLSADKWGFLRTRHYASPGNRLTLHTLRREGFARVRAGARPGRLLTRPFLADGEVLHLNFSTSAVGEVKVEALTAEGDPLAGFSGRHAARIFGDSVHHPVTWSGSRRWSDLRGRALRLRFTLTEADLYALQQASG
jgi:hypothetical protein